MKPEVDLTMLVTDLQAVASRLGYRRVTFTVYKREGSFCPTTRLMKRVGLRWSELCVKAGLLPTMRGCKGIDMRPCKRCAVVCNYYGSGQHWCKRCRQHIRETGFDV